MQLKPRPASAVALAASLLLSCGRPHDDFFDAEYSQWVDNARKLPTKRVYELYKIQVNMPPPSEPTLAQVLGERGREPLELMISDLMNNRREVLPGYFALVSEVNDRSKIHVCSDDNYYYRINRALEKGYGQPFPKDLVYRGSERTAFDRFCALERK